MYNFLSPEGVIVPDTSEILVNTNTEWLDTFGLDIDLNPESPQGILIASDVAVRSEVAANNAAIANQINPNYAGGVFLDDIWSLTGGSRRPAIFTIVDNVLLSGVPGVVIPSGSRRRTTAGGLFQLISTVTLNNSGTGVGTFQALEAGPIPCAAHSLTVPVPGYTSIGWETSDNPDDGRTGQLQQSDLSVRQERNQTLGLQGRSLAESVWSNVRALPGVRSLTFRENYTKLDTTIDGIFLLANSVWLCVDGGIDSDIAEALYRTKSGGADWNGSVSVDYRDPIFGQNFPVKFDRPSAKNMMVKVTGRVAGTITGNPVGLVKQALVDYANGLSINGEPGFVIGEDVSPFELASASNAAVPNVFISKVEIATESATPTWSVSTLEIALNEKAYLTVDNVQVVLS